LAFAPPDGFVAVGRGVHIKIAARPRFANGRAVEHDPRLNRRAQLECPRFLQGELGSLAVQPAEIRRQELSWHDGNSCFL